MSTELVILLATYNGARHLPAQLASIERQTLANWRLLASDDGSSDSTLAQLEVFRAKHPHRVSLLSNHPSGSPRDNFFNLLRAAPAANYIAFCDQDDVWTDDKLELLVATCGRLERRVGPNTPCLVFSDLAVVGSDLEIIAPSFFGEIMADPLKLSFKSLLVENAIPGCSMLINGRLIEVVKDFPGDLTEARMHDWWLALIAFSMGAVAFLPEQLVLYRQHTSNAAGSVKRAGARFALEKVFQSSREERSMTVRQAKLFLEAYGLELSASDYGAVAIYSRFDELGKLRKIWACLRMGLLKQTTRRRIFQLMTV